MKIKSLLSISATLMALSFTSSADPIDVNQALFNQPTSNGVLFEEVIFNWVGDCTDCTGARGVDREESTTVNGNIVLRDVIQDESGVINFDSNNIYSIQYDGPSNHVQPFILYNADFDTEDYWRDNSSQDTNITFSTDQFGDYFTALPFSLFSDDSNVESILQTSHVEFSESLSGSGSFRLDSEAYDATLFFDTYVPTLTMFNEETEDDYLQMINPRDPNLFLEFQMRKMTFEIEATSDGKWDILINGGSYDFGSGAKMTSSVADGTTYTPTQTAPVTQQDPNAVSEPSTLAIFGLALAGLARLGRRKVA